MVRFVFFFAALLFMVPMLINSALIDKDRGFPKGKGSCDKIFMVYINSICRGNAEKEIVSEVAKYCCVNSCNEHFIIAKTCPIYASD
ncbi:unnamed protein product [Caenorhabditis sp. 36 PRJEB53466]|nr:unnamed protein product [Caenorhabditis sp. 36 PRJEB53466]